MFAPASLDRAPSRIYLDPVDESIWYPAVPAGATANVEPTAVGVNLGLTFTVQALGTLHTMCYYRATADMPSSGSMAIWQIDGFTDVLLAKVDFTGHSGTGWQAIELPTPLKVNASHGYVVHLWLPSDGTSVVTTYSPYFFMVPKGFYSAPWNAVYAVFSEGNNDYRGFLRRNGLIETGTFARPVEGYEGAHFWLDVVVNFRPTPALPDPPLVLKWPIPEGWPSEETTGPAPGTVFGPPELDVYNVQYDGEIVENRDLRAGISNTFNNVIIRNNKIRGQGNFIIYNQLGADGTVIEDNLIDGVGRQNAGCVGIALGGIDMVIQRNNIQRVQDGMTLFGKPFPVNITIRDNFIHHMRAAPGEPHYDGIQLDGGGTTMLIEHNTVMNEQIDTSCIMLDNFGGPMDDITIQDNALFGGGYTCYYTDNFFPDGSMPLTNTRYLRNLMHVGVYAYFLVSAHSPSELPTFAGNQFLSHGGVVDVPPPGGFVAGQVVAESFHGYTNVLAGSIIGEPFDAQTGGLTLGTAFQAQKAGLVTSVNFGRPSSTSTQTVRVGLWRLTGSTLSGGARLLASRTFRDVARKGLVNFAFATPVAVAAGDNLVVGAFIPRGRDGKCWYFAQAGFWWPTPKHSQWDGMIAHAAGIDVNGFVGGNGVFHYGPDMTVPLTGSGLDTNYWVDPVFVSPWEA